MSVCIIGAGAAGLMAAVTAARNGAEVFLFERNEKSGKKLYITGKGRCNLTNNCDVKEFLNNVVTNPKFLYGAISKFGPAETMAFFESLGVPLKTERGNRVFPDSDKSSDIIRAFTKELERLKVNIFYGAKISGVSKTDSGFSFSFADDADIKNSALNGKKTPAFFDKVILACGGISYPLTGSTGDGFKFAAAFGHKVTPLRPALVPIILKEDYIKDMEGLSLKNIGFFVLKGGKKLYSDFGEMLFTGNGVSGPVIISASSLINKVDLSDVQISIDLKPALDMKTLDDRILRDFKEINNKQFKNSLNALLPQSLIPVIINLSGIDPQKELNQITKEERLGLANLLKDMRFCVKRLGAVEEGVVTSGGVSVDEINPRTMESKLIEGLYFAGEMIDVDAFTGGFNLQIAFSTARAAGLAAADLKG